MNMAVVMNAGGRVDDAAPELAINSVRKTFGVFTAVDRVDLTLRRGEILALLGASGCGKSTLLNMIAGFETPDFGTIAVRGTVINSIPPHRRNVAMVFQHYAMFPHLTVAGNIAYGLHARRLDKKEIAGRVSEMVGLLQLTGLQDRYPAQLSGGQRQRVAVARALAVRPDMLLLDEAFSALDRNLREDMQIELSLLLRRLTVTTILVTHDQREAFSIADRIAIMEAGRIAQIGTPEDVYRNPGSSSVLRFLGTTNRFEGVLAGAADRAQIAIAPGIVFTPAASTIDANFQGQVFIDLRAEDIGVSSEPTAVHCADPATVALRTFLGSQERIVIAFGRYQVVVDRPAQLAHMSTPLTVGQQVYLAFNPATCRLTKGQ